jgi:hypothetical protein
VTLLQIITLPFLTGFWPYFIGIVVQLIARLLHPFGYKTTRTNAWLVIQTTWLSDLGVALVGDVLCLRGRTAARFPAEALQERWQ